MSGFVYIWFDRKHSRYYIGSHWGHEKDGYICSSRWMKQAFRKRPQDFKRKILSDGWQTKRELLDEENKWLSCIKVDELGKRYYNLSRGKNHWSTNITPELKERLKLAGEKRKGWKHTEQNKIEARERTKQMWANNIEYREKMSGPNPEHSKRLKGRPRKGNPEQWKHTEEAKEKMKNSHIGIVNRALTWIVIYPNGNEETISNLSNFCRLNNLSHKNMAHRGHSKGYKCRRF